MSLGESKFNIPFFPHFNPLGILNAAYPFKFTRREQESREFGRRIREKNSSLAARRMNVEKRFSREL